MASDKNIILNAFDMSTIGHLSPGQWKRPEDRSAHKNTLEYWTNLAKTLERGGINALFLADTYGGHDTYEGSLDNCIRRAAQWPMTDPTIPISAMAAVTKNLAFGITASTSFEPPFLLAKRFSTLDHLTSGRIAWNIVTSWKKAAFAAIGLDTPIEHDQRYAQAHEYLSVLYKLWEASWADDAIVADAASDTYFDPAKIRTITHEGTFFRLKTPHIVDPTPQRTPFLFQAGTSPAGIGFAGAHAEAVFLGGQTPALVAPRVRAVREAVRAAGRDPTSVKIFVTLTPVLAATDAAAHEKLAQLRTTASVVGGMVLVSGWTGIDLAQFAPDHVLSADDSAELHKVTSSLGFLTGEGAQQWTPEKIAREASIGGLGPVVAGSPHTVADELQRWVREADVDGFNLAYVTTPASFEDVVDLLVPELRRRGVYWEVPAGETWTAREKIYGKGQTKLRDDHTGARYKYAVYKEDSE